MSQLRLPFAAVFVFFAALCPVATQAAEASTTARASHVLLRSSWQAVNIGDIGHTPGVLRLIERHFPEAQVTLWPMDSDPNVHELMRKSFPSLKFVRGAIDAQGKPTAEIRKAFQEADFLLHGSGPSVVALRDLVAWRQHTGKSYGIYGVTIDPVTALDGRTSEGGTLEELARRMEQLPAAHLDPSVRDVLDHARFIFCRDSLTLRYLRTQQLNGPHLDFAPDGAFGIELRDEARAEAYLRQHGLADGPFICVIPRLRYTPYYLMRNYEPKERDRERAAISAKHAERDLAKFREMIIRVVRSTKTRVLLCPEVTYQIDTARDFVLRPLPDDVKPFVVLRDSFWLPDEACSVYARSAAVIALDNHSPIFALTVGVPTMYVRQPTDTIKGRMWDDVGLGDWFCEIDPIGADVLTEGVLAILRDPPVARERVARIMGVVRERQAASMAVVRTEVLAAARGAAPATSDANDPRELARLPLAALITRIQENPGAAELRERFIAEARRDSAKELLRRPRTLAELQASRIPVKYDVRPPHLSALADAEWEMFCLSQADNKAGDLMKNELPRLAAAATLTGDRALLARVNQQLAELCTWSPLERSGWSLRNSNLRLRQDDGAWLGTGWLVRAMADAVELLPPAALTAPVREALQARLAAEVARMEEDWRTRRPPYVRSEAVHSNQWILPHEALVRAILFLGVDRHRAAYERGVANLLRSMDAQGRDGEFVEGLRYAALSLESLYSVARATARAGDERLRQHPFLQRFPTWLVHHFQPGGFLINAFDAPHSSRGHLSRDQAMLATAALVTGSPHAFWGLRTLAGFGPTLDAMAAATLATMPAHEPPPFAHYALATRINWRSSWDDERATGVWIRGGHATDYHDHMDRGHVNFIIGGRPLLIEAGTLTYASPLFPTHMKSVAGHNVLQVGSTPPAQLTAEALETAGQILTRERREAPIMVERMDSSGGRVTVDLSRCYQDVARWRRTVAWDSAAMNIADEVELTRADTVQFRWHLGVPAGALATRGTGRVEVGGVAVEYSADTPVSADVEAMPDATLEPNQITEHACVVVRTAAPVRRLQLSTRVSLGAGTTASH